MHSAAICDAIARKRLLRFRYHEHLDPTTVEPHLFGLNEGGSDALCAWLVHGFTHTDRPPFWRMYLEERMADVEVLEEGFDRPRVGYNPNDRRFTEIRCRL